MAKDLSEKQVVMMRRAANHGTCPGSVGVSTARSLVKRGLLLKPFNPGGAYYLTDAGKEWMAKHGA
jgi:hypothetical protein